VAGTGRKRAARTFSTGCHRFLRQQYTGWAVNY
jgi:hypothetical protein